MLGLGRGINPICDDGASMFLLLLAQQLADVRELCCILCVVLPPCLSEAMVGIARELTLHVLMMVVVLLLFVQ